jgi:hypothetical protein
MPDHLLRNSDASSAVGLALTPQQAIAQWIDLLDACDQLVLAGLRREIGPDGDLQAAYREWYRKEMEEHDRMLRRMVESFEQRSGRHGG